MQHTEKTAAKAESQRLRGLGFIEQRRIIQPQLAQSLTQILVGLGIDRKQPGKNLRLDVLKARQRFVRRFAGHGQGIADRRTVNVLDTGNDETDLTGIQRGALSRFGRKHADLGHRMTLTGRHNGDRLAGLKCAIDNTHQRDHPQIIIEPGINNQCLQRRARVALG